jgi:hypothetical protein
VEPVGWKSGCSLDDEAFHGLHPVVEAAGQLVEFLQQGLVRLVRVAAVFHLVM